MTQRNTILILLAFLLLGICYMMWMLFWRMGTLSVVLTPPFALDVKEYRHSIACTESPCEVRVPLGDWRVCLEKEGYETQCVTATIPWQNAVIWRPQLQKYPSMTELLSPLPEQPEEDMLHPKEMQYADIPHVLTPGGSLYVYQEKTEQVLLIEKSGEARVITPFTSSDEVQMLPWGEDLLLLVSEEIFFINTKNKSIYRIVESPFLDLRIISPQYFLLQTEKELWTYSKKNLLSSPLPFNAQVEHVILCGGEVWYFFQREEGRWQLFSWSEGKDLLAHEDVILEGLGDFTLSCGGKEEALLLEQEDGKRLLLSF